MCEVVLVISPNGVTWCSAVELRCTVKAKVSFNARTHQHFFSLRHNVKFSSCTYVEF